MGGFTVWIYLHVLLCFMMVLFSDAQEEHKSLRNSSQLMRLKCTKNEDCTKYDPNSKCARGSSQRFCKCKTKYTRAENGKSCVLRKVGGPKCKVNKDCKGFRHTECRKNRCQCKKNKEGCELRHLRAGPCNKDEECANKVFNSFCHFYGNDTVTSPNISETSPETLNSTEISTSSWCVCSKGYRESKDRDQCLENKIGDRCHSNEDCKVGDQSAVCRFIPGRGKACQCDHGYLAVGTGKHFLDPSCVGYEIDNATQGQCFKRKVGSPCEVDSDCNETVAFSLCKERQGSVDESQDKTCRWNKVCVCMDGRRPAGGQSTCRKLKLNERCDDSTQCNAIQGGAVCKETTCQCRDGYRRHKDSICVKRTLGDICSISEDCQHLENTECLPHMHNLQKTCQCKQGFLSSTHSNGSDICRRRQIGERCSRNEICSPETRCERGVCGCEAGWVANPDRYTCQRLSLGSYCTGRDDCGAAVLNSACQNQKCQCDKGYKRSNGECLKLKIGSYCLRSDGCSFAVTNSQCINRKCSCNSGFYASIDLDTCTLRRLGDNCNTYRSRDCFDAVPNSICQSVISSSNQGECQCELGFMDSGNKTSCRKRKLNDTCSKNDDCRVHTRYSVCEDGVCQCDTERGFEPFNSTCVWKPQRLYQQCTFNAQCKRLDKNSSCVHSRCECSNITFADKDYKTCLPLPSRIGSECGRHAHCQREINDSFCNNGRCHCMPGYFASEDNTSCPHEPMQLGDYCNSGILCKDFLANTVCNDSSCVCRYGYTNTSDTVCTERPRLEMYTHRERSETPVRCQNDVCEDWTNSTCTGPDGQKFCRCNDRTARVFQTSECVPAQTYKMRLKIPYEADVYDYKPFVLGVSKEAERKFADRLILSGVRKLFERSMLGDKYLSSEFLNVTRMRRRGRRNTGSSPYTTGGVRVLLLVHITADYLNAEKTETIFRAVRRQLRSSNGTLGESGLRVPSPYKNYVTVEDFNECLVESRNDCAKEANCINTLGSFMCVCKPGFVDVEDDLDYEVRGKQCKVPEKFEDPCLNGCDTNIEIVVIVLVLFVLTIMVFIVYEIIKRKKSFNARALYAKFGTTKIRKLQKASMKRLKEKKKRMKEESKKRREENRTKKEKMKKEGTTRKTEKNEEKKRKAEEKKKKREDAAELKKVKIEQKKSKRKKNKPGETPNLPTIELPPVPSSTSINLLTETGEFEASTISPVSSPKSPYDNLRSGTTTPATPYDNMFTYYPVASPDTQAGQAWNLQDSQESPV